MKSYYTCLHAHTAHAHTHTHAHIHTDTQSHTHTITHLTTSTYLQKKKAYIKSRKWVSWVLYNNRAVLLGCYISDMDYCSIKVFYHSRSCVFLFFLLNSGFEATVEEVFSPYNWYFYNNNASSDNVKGCPRIQRVITWFCSSPRLYGA